MTPPICECHGLPKSWQTDSRKKSGGTWRCLESKRESARRSYHADPSRRLAAMHVYFRQRYDNDPVWRIQRNLKRSREQRLASLARRRQQLEEVRHRTLSREG